jgi:hypothetical protein
VVTGTVMTAQGLVVLALVVVQSGLPALLDAKHLTAAVTQAATSFPGLSLAVLCSGVALVMIAVAAAALSPVPWRARLRLGRPSCSWALVPVLVIGVLALSQALDALAVLLELQGRGALPKLRQLMRGLPPGSLALMAAVMGLAPGLSEELVFRGYMQPRLIERWGGARGVAATALLFGALHLDPVQAPMAAVLGLYLGHVAWRANSVWPAVVCHVANNVVATLSMAWAPDHLGGRVSCVVQLVAGVALAAASLKVLERATRGKTTA